MSWPGSRWLMDGPQFEWLWTEGPRFKAAILHIGLKSMGHTSEQLGIGLHYNGNKYHKGLFQEKLTQNNDLVLIKYQNLVTGSGTTLCDECCFFPGLFLIFGPFSCSRGSCAGSATGILLWQLLAFAEVPLSTSQMYLRIKIVLPSLAAKPICLEVRRTGQVGSIPPIR